MRVVIHQKYSKGKKENGLLDVSGNRLAKALECKTNTPRITPKFKAGEVIINYGCSSIPWLKNGHLVYNKPEYIKLACNKIQTFEALNDSNIPIPKWVTCLDMAEGWLNTPKAIVFCRTLVNSSKGKGIVIARTKEELVEAPLYTLYIPKDEEYRVHVAFNNVIHIQKKKKLSESELAGRGITPTSPLIRNCSNGYVFSTNFDAELEDDGSYTDTKYFWMTEYSIGVITALGLDFGAVDLIVGKNGKVYVLEVNTAPGIEGITLEKYVNAFKGRVN